MQRVILLIFLVLSIYSNQASARLGGGIFTNTLLNGADPFLVVDGSSYILFAKYFNWTYEEENTTKNTSDTFITVSPFFKKSLTDDLNALFGGHFQVYMGDNYDSISKFGIDSGFEKKITEKFSLYGTFTIYGSESEKVTGGNKKTWTRLFDHAILGLGYFF